MVWNPAISAEFTEEPLQRSRFNLDQGDVYRRPTSDLLSSQRQREQRETFPLAGVKISKASSFFFYRIIIFYPGKCQREQRETFPLMGLKFGRLQV